jgi:hypothetical protein
MLQKATARATPNVVALTDSAVACTYLQVLLPSASIAGIIGSSGIVTGVDNRI